MKLKPPKFGFLVGFLVLAAVVPALDCGSAAAQEISTLREWMDEEGRAPETVMRPEAGWIRRPSASHDPRLYGPLESSAPYTLPLPQNQARASRRSAYVLLGGLVGGLAGFAVERVAKPCDGERFLGCSLRPYSYAAAGATVGIVIGLATGRIVEGPPRD